MSQKIYLLATVKLLSLLLCANAGAQIDLQHASIIPASERYIDQEKLIRPGTGWLALTEKNGAWVLAPAELHSDMVTTGVFHGVKLSSSQPQAIALLRHPHLKAGTVESIQLSDDAHHLPMPPRDGGVGMLWRGKQYQLTEKDGKVLLASGARKMQLGELGAKANDEYYSTLLWAGDLDGDGQPDFIVEFSRYDTGSICLFLSSIAERKKLVKQSSCWGEN